MPTFEQQAAALKLCADLTDSDGTQGSKRRRRRVRRAVDAAKRGCWAEAVALVERAARTGPPAVYGPLLDAFLAVLEPEQLEPEQLEAPAQEAP
jgi:hypothetical protein